MELKIFDPNSNVMITYDIYEVGRIFERNYVYIEACKVEFSYTWRSLFGIDECSVKGECDGQLMAVVGKYGTNQIYHIAYDVVEAKTRDLWQWFLDLLLEDLNNMI